MDAVAFAQESFGVLHLFVNNAGIMGALTSLDETSVEDFERTLRINLLSVFLGIKHAVRCVRSRQRNQAWQSVEIREVNHSRDV